MSYKNELHPDGRPVRSSPRCDAQNEQHAFSRMLEKDCRTAEARVAELEREVAWLRSFAEDRETWRDEEGTPIYFAFDVDEHLASKPPKGWKP
jgi:hypothetical protein